MEETALVDSEQTSTGLTISRNVQDVQPKPFEQGHLAHKLSGWWWTFLPSVVEVLGGSLSSPEAVTTGQ